MTKSVKCNDSRRLSPTEVIGVARRCSLPIKRGHSTASVASVASGDTRRQIVRAKAKELVTRSATIAESKDTLKQIAGGRIQARLQSTSVRRSRRRLVLQVLSRKSRSLACGGFCVSSRVESRTWRADDEVGRMEDIVTTIVDGGIEAGLAVVGGNVRTLEMLKTSVGVRYGRNSSFMQFKGGRNQ